MIDAIKTNLQGEISTCQDDGGECTGCGNCAKIREQPGDGHLTGMWHGIELPGDGPFQEIAQN